MKSIITKSMGFLLALAIILTGIPVTEVQAAAKPTIKSNQVTISNNSCTIRENQKVNLTAKSGKKNITKKGTWKSSKKTVATISKKGVLTAKKAGTTYITVKYKGKTSKKLKVVVEKNTTSSSEPGTEDTTKPTTEPETTSNPSKPAPAGSHTLTYNANGGTLNGSSTQSVAGEILNFATMAKAPSGKTFLGWFDAPTGGNRIYETYVVDNNMTLYAQYTNKRTQPVTFVTECNYGGTYSFMGGGNADALHYRDFDWLTQSDCIGPLSAADKDNVKWHHTYAIDDNDKFTMDNLPTPEVPGYEFVGWYTKDQNRLSRDPDSAKGVKVNGGQKLDAENIDPEMDDLQITLYARFTKKLTISFDDLRGGKYSDIVVDTYKSIKDCGKTLPVPSISGAKFKGWIMDIENHKYNNQASEPVVTGDTEFYNCVAWTGSMCSGCWTVSKTSHGYDTECKPDCDTHFNAVNDDWLVFEETDHITLYPYYEYDDVTLQFDPQGGGFYNTEENWDLLFDGEEDAGLSGWSYTHYDVGTLRGPSKTGKHWGSQPFGTAYKPGHEGEKGFTYGNGDVLPKVRRNNYTFDKWVYLDDDGVEREFTYDTILVKSMTVYAKWSAGTCYVMFDPTDGTLTQEELDRVGLDGTWSYKVTAESTIRDAGKEFPIPVDSKGRKFIGWFDKDGNEVTLDTKITGNITLYAHWGPLPKDLPVTINFDLNGGTITNDKFNPSVSITRGTKYSGFYTPTRDGYDFLGWYVLKPGATDYTKDASFIGTKLGNSLSISDNMIAGLDDGDDDNDTVTIVARWKEQAHAESIYMLDDTWETVPENKTYEVKYTGAGTSVPLGFGAVVMPETIKNKMLYWTVDDKSAITITGADSNGEYELMSSNWFEYLVFGNITPTRDGKTVVLTVTSRDNEDVKFSVKIHITFDEK